MISAGCGDGGVRRAGTRVATGGVMPSRTRSLSLVAAACSFAFSLAACTEEDLDKGPEDEVPTDGKLDSFQRPTDHGAIAFGPFTNDAALRPAAKSHPWPFTLSGNAGVHMYTRPPLTSRAVT